ncbi:uncharacterized protein LOC115881386 [Sitophilus oryzae]|uniref:Uncharacterized protein LOC115881386 n=1 Tax=Sitophilus oryzae TaxID=7048 RepID=A0A6J2XVC2_SITOR|nr:uncharacterized protein LOC115881386 [Sitophilus oryzae]
MLERINRKLALRVALAYCTCPTVAILCLVKIPPISLVIEERNQTYKNGTSFQKTRSIVLERWQTRWETYSRWTKTFIPNSKHWIKCDQANTDYYITQAMTGHGVLGEYLYRIRKANSPTCEASDSANHIPSEYHAHDDIRQNIETVCGTKITTENVETLLTKSNENIEAICGC